VHDQSEARTLVLFSGSLVCSLCGTSSKEAEKEVDKIKLCTFDISREIIQALSKKQMSFAVDQQQWRHGYLPVIFLANYAIHGAVPENDLILTGPSFVTPENVDRVANLSSADSP
jgi:ABC-type sugar transport system substrate-binding protein